MIDDLTPLLHGFVRSAIGSLAALALVVGCEPGAIVPNDGDTGISNDGGSGGEGGIGCSRPTGPEISVVWGGIDYPSGRSAALDFGNELVGSKPVTRSLTITNTGSAPLTLTGLLVPGGFTVVDALAATLAPDASETLTLALDSAGTGAFGGQVSFATNDADENPFVLTVSGEVTFARKLTSAFFGADSQASAVLGGTPFDIAGYSLVCGSGAGAIASSWGYKVLNALKVAGQLNLLSCQSQGDQVAVLQLKRFQRISGLPESNLVDAATLELLDRAVFASEQRDVLAEPQTTFSCYSVMQAAPPADATKAHLALLLQLAASVYPPALRPGASDCLDSQLYPVVRGPTSTLLCHTGYFPSYESADCQIQANRSVINLQSWDDFTTVNVTIHEQAHWVVRTGRIDPLAFYGISYDTSDQATDPQGRVYYRPRVDMNDDAQRKAHFFRYGEGWTSGSIPGYYTPDEDFAVSVEMYVLHGVVFRDYMSDKPAFIAKYAFLRDHVFERVEFDTGDPSYRSYAPDLNLICCGVVAPGGIGELRPNYVFDGLFPRRGGC